MMYWNKVTSGEGRLNIRSSPDLSATIVGTKEFSEQFVGTSPTVNDGYRWVQLLDHNYCAVQNVESDFILAEWYDQEIIISPSEFPIRSSIEWVSQLDRDSDSGNVDCGHASVLTVLKYADPERFEELTVDDLWPEQPTRTTGGQLVELAGNHGVKMYTTPSHTTTLNVKFIRERIADGQTVIPLVDYKHLGFPSHLAGGVDQGWHWLVLIGYLTSGDDIVAFVAHDPLWTPSQRGGHGGAHVIIPIENFNNAIHPTSSEGLVVLDYDEVPGITPPPDPPPGDTFTTTANYLDISIGEDHYPILRLHNIPPLEHNEQVSVTIHFSRV